MHRSQLFDAGPGSVAVTEYSRLLHSAFRSAVGYALASAIGTSGCAATSDQTASQPIATGATGAAPSVLQTVPSAPSSQANAGGAAPAVPSQQQVVPSAPNQQQPIPSAQASADDAGAPVKQAPRATPVSVACVSGMPQLFQGLSARRFDAAEFRVQSESTDYPQIWLAQGVLCSAATDPTACQSQVAVAAEKQNLLFAEFLPMFGMTARYVLTTLGNEVHKYQTREELLRFLGPIDSPQDALLLLYYDHRSVLCEPVDRMSSFSGVDPATFLELDDGYQALVLTRTVSCEGVYTERVTLHVATDGTVTETAREKTEPPQPAGCPGRLPEGLRSRHIGTHASALGEYLARAAHLEEASIAAFEVLAAELTRHSAPAELITWARRAAADEVRHTATTRELALRFGASATTAEVAPRALRSLEAIAIENAREGCVRECFGAALGCYQAQSATDPDIAAAMAEIAEDETRHAALAFAVDAWVQPLLDDRGRARVAAARAQAVSDLGDELACVPDAATRAALGLPDAIAALRLYSSLEQSLWAAS